MEKIVEVYEEMIALNPGAHQGIRGVLLHRYLCLKRLSEAEKLLERFPDDLDLGIVYGRVLLELIKILDTDFDFDALVRKERSGHLSSSAFGPPFAKAKARMKEALKINPYIPALMAHPTSLYLETPTAYKFGSPEQAMTFVNDHDVCPAAIGRKNWLFVGSPEAGDRSATLYSLLISARHHGVDPEAYLCNVIERLPGCGNNEAARRELLPENWAVAQRSS